MNKRPPDHDLEPLPRHPFDTFCWWVAGLCTLGTLCIVGVWAAILWAVFAN